MLCECCVDAVRLVCAICMAGEERECPELLW